MFQSLRPLHHRLLLLQVPSDGSLARRAEPPCRKIQLLQRPALGTRRQHIARIGCRRNATIAETLTSRGFAVRVSFELADSPAVSLCFVHSPGQDESHFIRDPHILSVARAFVLLVISFAGGARRNSFHDYFVYRAGRGSTLSLYPTLATSTTSIVGVLPVGDHYAVAIPVSSYNNMACSMNFNLRVFWSVSRRWTTKNAPLARDSETDYLKAVSHHATPGDLSWRRDDARLGRSLVGYSSL